MANDLEKRTFKFAKAVRKFCRSLKWDVVNVQDIKQLVRASGSVAANYIEANENLGDKDFKMRIRISRKEAKESGLFLALLETSDNTELEAERRRLIQETVEFRKILTTILNNHGRGSASE